MAKNYIKVLTSNDQKFLFEMAHCGRSFGGKLNIERLRSFIKQGWVVQEEYVRKRESVAVFSLTQKGKSMMEKKLNVTSFYKSSSIKHDVNLIKEYSNPNIAKWETESQIRDAIRNEITKISEVDPAKGAILKQQFDDGKISALDARIIYEDGSIELIEVTTRRYGKEEIESKIRTAELLGNKYRFIKARSV